MRDRQQTREKGDFPPLTLVPIAGTSLEGDAIGTNGDNRDVPARSDPDFPCRASLVQTVNKGSMPRRIAPPADGATSAPMPGAAGLRPRRGLSVSDPTRVWAAGETGWGAWPPT